jgi:hypothetical protein
MKGVLPPLPDEGQVEFTAGADDVYRLAVEDLNRAGGPGMVYHLDVNRAGKDFALSVDVDKVELTPGGTGKVKVKAERQGYGGPITVALRGAPDGVTLGQKSTIPSGKGELDVEISAPVGFAATGTPTQFMIVGTGTGDAATEHVASTLTPLRRMFPRMMFVPIDLDGPIGLWVRPPKGTAG